MPARFLDEPQELPQYESDPEENSVPEFPSPECKAFQDVVISGISCRLPESDNMEEFKQNLMNGVDMVTEDDRRWQPGEGLVIKFSPIRIVYDLL